MKYWVSAGSNIHPELYMLRAAKKLLDQGYMLEGSSQYCTAPIGRPEQADYRNAVWRIETSERIEKFQENLSRIELECDRIRIPDDKYAARTMDLDLIGCDHQFYDRKELAEREFLRTAILELEPALEKDLPRGRSETGAVLDIDRALTERVQSLFREGKENE